MIKKNNNKNSTI